MIVIAANSLGQKFSTEQYEYDAKRKVLTLVNATRPGSVLKVVNVELTGMSANLISLSGEGEFTSGTGELPPTYHVSMYF